MLQSACRRRLAGLGWAVWWGLIAQPAVTRDGWAGLVGSGALVIYYPPSQLITGYQEMMLGPRNYHNTAEHPASMLASLSAGTVASRGWNAGHQAPVGAQPPGGNFDFIILGSQLPRSWALMSLEVVEDKFQALMVVNV